VTAEKHDWALMPTYAFLGFDQPPHSMALRERLRAEHRAYVLAHDAAIRFAGAQYDAAGNQCGTLIIFEADSAQQVRAWLEQEPFYRGGVYRDVQVIEWRLALNRFDLMEWAQTPDDLADLTQARP
jgi:uncharacterized protein YciI